MPKYIQEWDHPQAVKLVLAYSQIMQIGQLVRIVKVPDELPDDKEFRTQELVANMLGKIFPISDFQGNLLALDVGELSGKPSYLETFYIEPECVELVAKNESSSE